MRTKVNAEELFNRAAGVVIYIAVFPKVFSAKDATLLPPTPVLSNRLFLRKSQRPMSREVGGLL